MVESATTKTSSEEEKDEKSADDPVLDFFNEICLFEGLKKLKTRERDASLRDEI